MPSSGSTGEPKYIPLSHAILQRRVERAWQTNGDDRETLVLGIGLSTGWAARETLRALWQGGTMVISLLQKMPQSLARHNVTLLSAPPQTLTSLVQMLPADFERPAALRRIEVGGSALPD